MFKKIIWILVMAPTLGWANAHFSDEMPNLSIEISDEAQSHFPSRSERLRAFELLDLNPEALYLDELDQDLYYWKKLRNKLPSSEPKPIVPTRKQSAAKKTILFFDINFAPAEINAAREAAAARGENLIVLPERTEQQQKTIEKEYRELIALKEQIIACHNDSTKDCSFLEDRFNATNERLKKWIKQIKKIESMTDTVANLVSRKIVPSIVVFSGHSGGDGHFSGVFGSLGINEFSRAIKAHPQFIETVESILLWGCYSGTLASFSEFWQKSVSGKAAYVGFRNQAPLGIRPASGRLLKSYLLSETNFLSAKSSQKAHSVFRELDLVATLDATAVKDDTYFTYEKAAKISELIKLCNEFDPKLLDSYACYDQGKEGCENPPVTHQGPLRQLYSFLQVNRHCQAFLQKDYPLVPTPEAVIRLIYIDNVKLNFAKHHQHEFQSFNELLAQLQLSENFQVHRYINSSRSEDTRRIRETMRELETLGLRDGSYHQSSNWMDLSRFYHTMFSLKRTYGIGAFMFPTSCVPFSWVEPDSDEMDSCGFGTLLVNPLSKSVKQRLYQNRMSESLYFDMKEYIPNVYSFIFTSVDTLDNFKKSLLLNLKWEIEYLEKATNKSAKEVRWLEIYIAVQNRVQKAPPSEGVLEIIDYLQIANTKLDALIFEAKSNVDGESALEYLTSVKSNLESRLRELQELTPERLR